MGGLAHAENANGEGTAKSLPCSHKRIAIYSHTGWPSGGVGGDDYDGSDTQWEIYCADCELTIAEGDGWDDPEVAYKKWLAQRRGER